MTMRTQETAVITWCDNRESILLKVFGHGHYGLLLPIPIRTTEIVWTASAQVSSVEMWMYHGNVLRHHYIVGAVCGIRQVPPFHGPLIEVDNMIFRIKPTDSEPEEPMHAQLSSIPMDAADTRPRIDRWIDEHLRKIEPLQKVEINVAEIQDPSRVARLVKEQLEKMADRPYVRATHLFGAEATAPVNDHVCTTCGNDRCSKSEKACWKCGNVIV